MSETRRYLEACRAYGLALRLHADQFSERGALPLAIELGARSVDHLEATGEEGARALAKSAVTAVLLPACGLFLGLPDPPARLLADEGAIVALATDFNPGSSFCESLPPSPHRQPEAAGVHVYRNPYHPRPSLFATYDPSPLYSPRITFRQQGRKR